MELIQLGRKHGYDKLRETVAQTRATSLARNTRWARQWSSSECTYSRWPTKGFELEEKRFTTVDKRGCVRAGTNWYSTPLKPGQRVMVKLLPLAVEAWRDGRVMAQHERCYDRNRSLYDANKRRNHAGMVQADRRLIKFGARG